MSGEERVHESLEIRTPPLRESITNLPGFVDTFARELRADRSETFVEALLKAVDFFIFIIEVVAWPVFFVSISLVSYHCKLEVYVQFKESIRNLQHQDMRVVMFMANQDPFASPSHAIFIIMLLQAFQARQDRRVFLRLGFLGAEGVVGERVQADSLWLMGGEVLRENGTRSIIST